MGGLNLVYNHYDFYGEVLNTYKSQSSLNNTTVPETYTYTYDHAGRPLATMYQLKTKPSIILSSFKYDELGRLIKDNRHNNVDTVYYAYNIRNWTTAIKSGTFVENLYYNTNPLSTNLSYNGNISYSTWSYGTEVKGYQYSYDDLNRLKNSYFKKGTSTRQDGNFDEYFEYDKMGNATTLKRLMNGYYIDNLSLTYNGNQLSRVGDAAGSQNQYAVKEYNATTNNTSGPSLTYDKNGNLVYDYDRKIAAIRYNILNLPDTIQFSAGHQIINKYDASGRKLKTDYYTLVTPLAVPLTEGKVNKLNYIAGVVNLSGTSYMDNIEYPRRTDGLTYANGGKVYNSEGYSIGDALTTYYYYRKDHLGNIREVISSSKSVAQRTQYYPSGLPWAEGSGASLQTHKYNGKEFDEMNGYDNYDYGARGYYPAIGRFTTVDPLAERAYDISPYVYCHNNPVNRIDPDGRIDMDKQTQKKYPELTAYVKGLAKEWNGKSAEFKKAFMDKSGLNEKQVVKMLTFGKGPKLVVANLDNATSKTNGGTSVVNDPKTGKDTNDNGGKGLIKLDNDVVNMMEKAQTGKDRQVGNIMVESTTFHELTHVGNLTTSHTTDGTFNESGKAFEIDAFGKDINRSNVNGYWQSIQPQSIPTPATPTLQTQPVVAPQPIFNY
jgi:RHS repeat-associated protein